MRPRPRVVISACLLGEPVRYDGRHRRDPGLADALQRRADLIRVCPEVECGLPVPRPPMRLEGDPAAPRLVVIADRADHTARFRTWLARSLEELAAVSPAAFVLKARSPSCGVSSTPVFDAGGRPVATGGGLFARAVRARFPAVPLFEETDLLDPADLERFLSQLPR